MSERELLLLSLACLLTGTLLLACSTNRLASWAGALLISSGMWAALAACYVVGTN